MRSIKLGRDAKSSTTEYGKALKISASMAIKHLLANEAYSNVEKARSEVNPLNFING